ncbi:MAG: endolytic transglycosylase MltG [Patescibacteria group bacterium]
MPFGLFFKRIYILVSIAVVFAAVFLLTLLGVWFAPRMNVDHKEIVIASGASAWDIGALLESAGIIRSTHAFVLTAELTRKDRALRPGPYVFTKSANVFDVIARLTSTPEARTIRIVEGWDSRRIAAYLSERGILKSEEFYAKAVIYEGELFPDTYEIPDNVTADELIALMRNNFRVRTRDLVREAETSGKSLREILIIASLLAREANGEKDAKIISGIIQNRLADNFPLQIDATLTYITGLASRELGDAELNLDSPYNTYEYKGLPPGPIGNPGLEQIDAALHPTASAYWYYLHSRDGTPYYARTFEEHKQNKALYLR